MKSEAFDELINLLKGLPGVGIRSARRMALKLIQEPHKLMKPLSQSLQAVAEEVKTCSVCHNIDTVNPCGICADNNRDLQTVCVVEQIADLWAIEGGGSFKGKYHVLGGSLSALDGRTPNVLNFESLFKRVLNDNIKELIIATSATLEGQTTTHYIADSLKESAVQVSRLAYGIPMGAELEYIDEGTLSIALQMRKKYE